MLLNRLVRAQSIGLANEAREDGAGLSLSPYHGTPEEEQEIAAHPRSEQLSTPTCVIICARAHLHTHTYINARTHTYTHIHIQIQTHT
jgi:hypothetical protein